jgi:hypothetical protein
MAMALHVVEAPGLDEVTLAEAAGLLGVHANTVRNRIKSGAYTARKVRSTVGPEVYLLGREQLELPTAPVPASWGVVIKQAFWSDDPRLRRVQAIQWIVGGALLLLAWAFVVGRAWEMISNERREGTPRK